MLLATLKRARHSFLRIADQAVFDWRYQTETSVFVPVEAVSATSTNRAFSCGYQPTNPAEFHRIMARIPRSREHFTFIDLGCGKGRILLLAAQAGFRQVTGVEFSPELVEIARKNIAIFQHRVPGADIRVIPTDAAEFELPPGDCVLYMFNPFGARVMEQVVKNLAHSHALNPRKIYVALWHCAQHYPLFDRLPFLRRMSQMKKRRNWLTAPIYEWVVYAPNAA